MNDFETRTTSGKALRTNLDTERYGAFAEIGAGQEVARHYFIAGKASQTVAKSMSAYDMTYSDEIYGKEKSGRYVCESRLMKMLEKEYTLLLRRLSEKRGKETSFFAFANTVATGTPETPKCHGWMGVRFQAKPSAPFNDIIVHVRMMDRTRIQQQDALGVLGVNLLDAAFYCRKNPEHFIDSLTENLKPGQVIFDMIKFSGPDLAEFENQKMNLELVRRGLAEAVLFNEQGQILSIADATYGKGLLVQRGAFRPMTVSHEDVLSKGLLQFRHDLIKQVGKKLEIQTLLEIHMPDGTKPRDIEEFQNRISLIGAAGYPTLVTNMPLYYELKRFLRKHTQAPLAFVLGASKLSQLFNESHYNNLEGGLPEALGKLLDDKTKLYIYPHKTANKCLTAKTYRPAQPADRIYDFFMTKNLIADIADCDQSIEYKHSSEVRKKIERKDRSWEQEVPAALVALIKKNKMWMP